MESIAHRDVINVNTKFYFILDGASTGVTADDATSLSSVASTTDPPSDTTGAAGTGRKSPDTISAISSSEFLFLIETCHLRSLL